MAGLVTDIDVHDKKRIWHTIEGHKLDSRVLIPATGYLAHVWKLFADSHGKHVEDFPAYFENVSIERATIIQEGKSPRLTISILADTGAFEVREEDALIVKGIVKMPDDVSQKMLKFPPIEIPAENPDVRDLSILNTQDVYKELKLRGYNYQGEFRGIQRVDSSGKFIWKIDLDSRICQALTGEMSNSVANSVCPKLKSNPDSAKMSMFCVFTPKLTTGDPIFEIGFQISNIS